MKITLNVDANELDHILVEILKEDIQQRKQDLKKKRPLVFENDPKKDKALIKEHINHLQYVVDYFCV